MSLIKDLWRSRKLILKLAVNDFKTKYAGSYLGLIWGFVNPIITVLVFWFVFEVGFKSPPVSDYPFVLWLVCGLVPWFFFSEALNNATNCMMEYSYLVKKIVFKVSVLPIVKIISSMFVHIFFIGFVFVLFFINGITPTWYVLQVFYYSLCVFVYVLGLAYFTSSVVLFFKDLSQIIAIFLQVGMWMTPIMWNYEMVPEQYRWLLKFNPMYYIVEGYRDAFINHIWFWEKYNQTAYFFVLVSLFFFVGALTYKRLKSHFADVL